MRPALDRLPRTRPEVSVITATRGTADTLISRCIPSVQAQTFAPLEHVIVSEWSDELAHSLKIWPGLRFCEVGPWNRDPSLPFSPGAMAYMVGTRLAMGRYIAYCGDDDELLPNHLELLVQAIESRRAEGPDAPWFATAKTDFKVRGSSIDVIGDGSLQRGHLDTIGILHEGECLHYGNWDQTGECSDFELVDRWRRAGLNHVYVPVITSVHHDGWLARQQAGKA
jgi:glycosyltransferase involved in cell wall biosynthesis